MHSPPTFPKVNLFVFVHCLNRIHSCYKYADMQQDYFKNSSVVSKGYDRFVESEAASIGHNVIIQVSHKLASSEYV